MSNCLPVRLSIENAAITAGKIAHLAECGAECLVGDVSVLESRSGNIGHHDLKDWKKLSFSTLPCETTLREGRD